MNIHTIMGCTTSAPTVPTPDVNITGHHIRFIEEVKEKPEAAQITTEVQIESHDVKVLPTCDNLVDSIQLARNNKTEKPLLEESVVNAENVCQTSENKAMELESVSDDKINGLEKVVEKLIECFDSKESLFNNIQFENDSPKLSTQNKNQVTESNTPIIMECEHEKKTPEKTATITPEKSTENHEENIASPSQSESSRATRWEALADIAAELPPSLTVDPITGQIYSVAK